MVSWSRWAVCVIRWGKVMVSLGSRFGRPAVSAAASTLHTLNLHHYHHFLQLTPSWAQSSCFLILPGNFKHIMWNFLDSHLSSCSHVDLSSQYKTPRRGFNWFIEWIINTNLGEQGMPTAFHGPLHLNKSNWLPRQHQTIATFCLSSFAHELCWKGLNSFIAHLQHSVWQLMVCLMQLSLQGSPFQFTPTYDWWTGSRTTFHHHMMSQSVCQYSYLSWALQPVPTKLVMAWPIEESGLGNLNLLR